MLNPDIKAEDVKEFKGSAVWEEIELRLAQKQEVLFSNLINPESTTDLKDKLAYAIYAEVRDYPDLFLEELKLDKEEKDAERRTEQGRTGARNRF